MVNHMDRQVETLLKFLDDTLGENSYQVAFTAAHGIADAAQKRISAQEVAAELQKRCDLESFVYPFIYLRSGNAEAAVKALPQAAAWYTASGACSHTGMWIRRRLKNSFHAKHSGDAIIVPTRLESPRISRQTAAESPTAQSTTTTPASP